MKRKLSLLEQYEDYPQTPKRTRLEYQEPSEGVVPNSPTSGLKLCSGFKSKVGSAVRVLEHTKTSMLAFRVNGDRFRSQQCKQTVFGTSTVCEECQRFSSDSRLIQQLYLSTIDPATDSCKSRCCVGTPANCSSIPNVDVEYYQQFKEFMDIAPKNSRYFRLCNLMICYGITIQKGTTNGFRWKENWEEEFHFLSYIATQCGERVTGYLRGNHAEKLKYAHFPFPSPESIRNYYQQFRPKDLSLESLNDICRELARETIKAARTMNPKIKQNFGLAFDGIDIVESVERLGNIIFGLSKDVTITDFVKTDIDKILHSCAGNILQFFLVSLDKSIVLPIHIFPYTDLADQDVASIVESIQKDFESLITITWVSSDGEHETLESVLNDLTSPCNLFRDSDHVTKCGRNAIIKNKLRWIDPVTHEKSEPVSLNLVEIIKQDSFTLDHIRMSLRTLLDYSSAIPSSAQKLSMNPVKRVTKKAFVQYLLDYKLTWAHAVEIQSLGRYLKLLNSILYLWDDTKNEQAFLPTVDERISHIKQELPQLEIEGKSHFIRFCSSIVRNYETLKSWEIPDICYTVLVTRMVENWFSIMRYVVSHPTVLDYVQIYQKKLVNFGKEHSTLFYFPMSPCINIEGKNYHKLAGIKIDYRSFERALIKQVSERNKQCLFAEPLVEEQSVLFVVMKLLRAQRRIMSLAQTKYSGHWSKKGTVDEFFAILDNHQVFVCREKTHIGVSCNSTFMTIANFVAHMKRQHNIFDSTMLDISCTDPSEIATIQALPKTSKFLNPQWFPSPSLALGTVKYQIPTCGDTDWYNSGKSWQEVWDQFLQNQTVPSSWRVPALFSPSWDVKHHQRFTTNKAIFVIDFETQGAVTGSINQPLTGFALCLNTLNCIYLTFRPHFMQITPYVFNLHKISLSQVNILHETSVEIGLTTLIDWMTLETETCELTTKDMVILAHNASFEARILIDYTTSETYSKFVKSLEFWCSRKILQLVGNSLDTVTQSSQYISPYVSLCDNEFVRTSNKVSLALSDLAVRFQFGVETHNCLDDVLLLVAVLLVVFKQHTPEGLVRVLLNHKPKLVKSDHKLRKERQTILNPSNVTQTDAQDDSDLITLENPLSQEILNCAPAVQSSVGLDSQSKRQNRCSKCCKFKRNHVCTNVPHAVASCPTNNPNCRYG
jgi:hypothetical protein